ncbi:glycoside hydrolase family 3 N-terminal domain-containing protein [Sphingomonas sp. BIUV-7]|uniref:Glycoside hydrolase family 3 N-terminal domain-containing protein n=1 Tax=Sphingomonas natans TaxID=3063330 RepID=A0ABT8YBG6_9SPHN|nr:glycoside hydrolase family 3 N-terminal domain-containing protein [Sphingomonas sp. BIUV-7]MDO6415332.1 glycoside hydrolase family 3 N-terminal domain-containing protein [Sphingomonas sp. BIUV-7]
MARRCGKLLAGLLSTGFATGAIAAPALPWMSPAMVERQQTAKTDEARESVARQRARQLIAALSKAQKLQQLTGSSPGTLPELPQCFGGRHVTGIPALGIPTFRITNGPVGVGQNDCVSFKAYDAIPAGPARTMAPYTHPSSAQATALPSAIAVAASFDPRVATSFGDVIATEMHNLALHVFEAPGMNLARLPVLGRNFEYFGEDPLLAGTMAVAETKAVQSRGLIAMAKHFVANEQETNRMTIREIVDEQVLRELYLIPFEMSVKDGHVGGIMCSYNYVNGLHACENTPLLTGVLRNEWKFSGYVQSDFFAMKSTAPTLAAGMDHEMPIPIQWTPDKLHAALTQRAISMQQIDMALQRRYTQMFKAGIFDRPLVQTPIDFAADGHKAREIGVRSAVLLQNNGALPLARTARTIALVGKASQVYVQQAISGGSILGKPMGAGGGSSDVVPHGSVAPLIGLRNALKANGRESTVALVLVDDANTSATIDGKVVPLAAAIKTIAASDAVVIMAGTNSEEFADRATFSDTTGYHLAASAATGSSLDWYVSKPNQIATTDAAGNPARSSQTVAMIAMILAAQSTSDRPMAEKTALVLKDNAGVSLDPRLIGTRGPSILEVWFPGQEDGNIVADLLLGAAAPSGKLPVTFPFAGKGFLDTISPQQFPGVPGADGTSPTVTYSEKLTIGYRWYDANVSKSCALIEGRNPCVAFAFGFGLSYTQFATSAPKLSRAANGSVYRVSLTVRNRGARAGAEVVQAYLSLPVSADSLGAPQPPKRLVGFERVELNPGETREVSIVIDPAASNHPLGVWDTRRKGWITPSGRYVVRVGTSSAPNDLLEAGNFTR